MAPSSVSSTARAPEGRLAPAPPAAGRVMVAVVHSELAMEYSLDGSCADLCDRPRGVRHPMLAQRATVPVQRSACSRSSQQVLGGLDPHRQPQQAVADAEALALVAAQVRHARSSAGRVSRRLHAAEARCERRDAQRARRTASARAARPRAARSSARRRSRRTDSRARACCGCVARPGIVHALHRRRVPQGTAATLQRAVVLVAHAQREGLQPALEQERRVRVERAAEQVELVADALDQLRAPGDRAGDDVGVAVQVLGGAVDRQIEAGRRSGGN